MKYKVDQFTFFKMSEKEYVLQNSSGISIINNSKLIKFFLELDYTNRLEISDEDIQSSFDSEKDNAKNFLLSNNMIREIVKKTAYDKVIYIANNDSIQNSLIFNSEGHELDIDIRFIKKEKNISQSVNILENDKDALFIIILNPFDYHFFLEICDYLSSMNVRYLVSFTYNSKYYFTNIHKKDWYNPCPKCFIAHLISSLRAKSKVNNTTTFQTIIDIIYNKNISYDIYLPVSNINTLAVIAKLLSFSNHKTALSIDDLSNEIVSVNLDGDIDYDQAIHWEICDCLEK